MKTDHVTTIQKVDKTNHPYLTRSCVSVVLVGLSVEAGMPAGLVAEEGHIAEVAMQKEIMSGLFINNLFFIFFFIDISSTRK